MRAFALTNTAATKADKHRGRTIGEMHRRFGIGPADARCKACLHFWKKRLGNTYLKCERFGNSGGAATDWRANWPACGLFEKRG